MKEQEKEKRQRVLDPVSRISEIIFGVLMALSFTGALNAATTGREEVRTMMMTALGCNLAWGLVDAVMYLVATMTGRARNLTLLNRVRGAVDPKEAHSSIAEALPAVWAKRSVRTAWRTCAGGLLRSPMCRPE